jgi:hypothetical protein
LSGLKNHVVNNKHNRRDLHVIDKPATSVERVPAHRVADVARHRCPEADCAAHIGWVDRDAYEKHWRKKHGGAFVHGRQWRCGLMPMATRAERVECAQEKERYPTPPNEPTTLLLYGVPIERVHTFKYLGRVVDGDTRTHLDDAAVGENLVKAKKTWMALEHRFIRSKKLRSNTKIRVYKAVCQSQFVYGSESWVVSKRMTNRMDSWQARCLRHCTGMQPRMVKIDGEEQLRMPKTVDVLRAASDDALSQQVAYQMVREVGRILRQSPQDSARKLFLSSVDATALPRRTEESMLRSRALAQISALELPEDGGTSHGQWCRTALKGLCPTAFRKRNLLLAAAAKKRSERRKVARDGTAVPTPARTFDTPLV